MGTEYRECQDCEYFEQQAGAEKGVCLMASIVTNDGKTPVWPPGDKSWCRKYMEEVVQADEIKAEETDQPPS